MVDYERMVTRQRKWMLYLLVIFVVGAAITPYKRVFLGLLLGHVVSYYGLRLLQNRAKAFGKAIVEEGRTPGLGTFLRLLGAGVAVLIALKWNHKVDLIALVFGLMTSYVVMLVDIFFASLRQTNEK